MKSTQETQTVLEHNNKKAHETNEQMPQSKEVDVSLRESSAEDILKSNEISNSSSITMATSDVSENETEERTKVKRKNITIDLVSIGDGNAKVPSRLLDRLNWSSYTNVTRKLLTAVFSRNVLATHSLTGRPSPAFPDKPAKKKLNSAIVNDIVQTVVQRCKVSERLVRVSITTKCADEAKMLRNRNLLNKRRVSKLENTPPSDSDSP
ncbi:protein insensitive-like [Pectinophora gossypiella]|uniref:protein insensitive-like n=1 Tax=Pectinophora gossypiella TaxID=13191 RepID=UPI00214E5256|nr:protein insensitive-like [Pectinophora gossypiella]